MPQWLTDLGATLKDPGFVVVLLACGSVAGGMAREFVKNFRAASKDQPLVAPPSHAAQTQMLVPTDRMTLEMVQTTMSELLAVCRELLARMEEEREEQEEEAREARREERFMRRMEERLRPPSAEFKPRKPGDEF